MNWLFRNFFSGRLGSWLWSGFRVNMSELIVPDTALQVNMNEYSIRAMEISFQWGNPISAPWKYYFNEKITYPRHGKIYFNKEITYPRHGNIILIKKSHIRAMEWEYPISSPWEYHFNKKISYPHHGNIILIRKSYIRAMEILS